MEIYFYWNADYIKELGDTLKLGDTLYRTSLRSPVINIKNHIFSPNELRSLRHVEVILLSSSDAEFAEMRSFQKKTLNPYGIVSVVKRPRKNIKPLRHC